MSYNNNFESFNTSPTADMSGMPGANGAPMPQMQQSDRLDSPGDDGMPVPMDGMANAMGGPMGAPYGVPNMGPGGTVSPMSPHGSSQGKTTLMGELEPWIDESFVRNIWNTMGYDVSVKMIRDKFSGNAGYCFVDFKSPDAANAALQNNGQIIPNTNRPFKLNWASGGGLSDRNREDRGPEFSVFVGDLGPEVNEDGLMQLFKTKFPNGVKSVKIMTDPITGVSRGYGFVRFSNEGDQQDALRTMPGVYCGNRPIRVSTATPKNKSNGPGGPGMNMSPAGGPMGMYHHMGGPPMAPAFQSGYGAPQPMNQFTDPNNTTVFVGGLSGYVTEDELRSFFQGFGEITYVKIPPGKGCGFVQFVQRHAAEMAINQMQGYPIGNSRVRLSWGRSQNNSGPAGTPYRPAPPPPVFGAPQMPMPPNMAPYGYMGGMNNMSPMKLPVAFRPVPLIFSVPLFNHALTTAHS
ncbi:RNA-binding domain-containing protein [Sporormia fimetaria CBS 119925]|uniref:RNA-binding domain-containing protein n=1 Tax=Sporormia fimetaria CBS 119925 TaxID=1340428 RepID=A0A6A6VLN2_9PLEO|nr:RNA-binding domain-containing protein [Sporormia fimetaria CBS 119925]